MGCASDLAATFPSWRVWRSDGGAWWATRRYRLTDDQLDAGLAATVAADDLAGLRVQLRQQARREGHVMAVTR